MYSVLLGDWGLFDREEDFDSKPTALIAFVVFSFFIAIVLLNVLIAIISDSYKKCLYRSRHLFGRSRVFLLSELVAFRDISVFQENSSNSGYKRWHPLYWMKKVQSVNLLSTATSVRSLLIASLGMILFWGVAELLGVSRAHSDDPIFKSVLLIIGTIVLNFIVFIGFLSLLSGSNSNSGSNILCRIITWLMLRLLGGAEESSTDEDDRVMLQFDYFSERIIEMMKESETRILNEMQFRRHEGLPTFIHD